MVVFELPLFPLNTVLFPRMPLQLHIFEDRYQQMMNLCIKQDLQFGVAMIRRGWEANGPLAEPFEVGTTARIVDVQYLAEGRMNIAAVGEERFRTIALDRGSKPYLNGILLAFPLEDPDSDAVEVKSKRLIPLYKRYLQVLSAAGGVNLEAPELPREPTLMAYLAATTLQVTNDDKQRLLEIRRTLDLLTRLHHVYRREISLLRSMEDKAPPREVGRFSIN